MTVVTEGMTSSGFLFTPTEDQLAELKANKESNDNLLGKPEKEAGFYNVLDNEDEDKDQGSLYKKTFPVDKGNNEDSWKKFGDQYTEINNFKKDEFVEVELEDTQSIGDKSLTME